MKRSRLHQGRHLFNRHPFEALIRGSWQSVKLIEIRDGAMTLHYADSHHRVEGRGPVSDIRIKSRQAALFDCTCFLRPGIDVCVLSSTHYMEGSEEGNSEPVWVDAKISSIERKPHGSECSCQFFINIYTKQGSLGSEFKGPLSKDTEVVGISQISILQRLANSPCEGEFYRWDFSEDCSLVQRTKLFSGKFSSDLTWLLVASVVKEIAFVVTSEGNKIIYQISGFDNELFPVRSDSSLCSVSFKVEDGLSTPTVMQFTLGDDSNISTCDVLGSDSSPLDNDVMNLRRSKRRNVQPNRFLGCDLPPVTEFGWIRAMPYKPLKWREEELFLPLSQVFAIPMEAISAKEQTESEMGICSSEEEPLKNLPLLKTKNKSRQVGSGVRSERAHENQLAIVPVKTEADQVAPEQLHSAAKTPRKYSEGSTHEKFYSRSKQRRSSDVVTSEQCVLPAKIPIKCSGTSTSETCRYTARTPRKYSSKSPSETFRYPAKTPRKFLDRATGEQSSFPAKTPCKYSRKTDGMSSGYYGLNSSPPSQRKVDVELEDMVLQSSWEGEAARQNVDRGSFQKNNVERGRYYPMHPRRDGFHKSLTYKSVSFREGVYNNLINSYMKCIDSTLNSKEEPHIIDQWKEFKAKGCLQQQEKTEPSTTEDEEESSEIEALWREMELCLASAGLFDEDKGLESALTKRAKTISEQCRHEFKLDEEIGILCSICGFVRTEIRYVSAPFNECMGWKAEDKPLTDESSELKPDEDERLNLFRQHVVNEEVFLSEKTDTVWELIPEVRMKLHAHQKKAFEFLWRNIAGSIVPEQMENQSKKLGGCVISHSPGAGKTFLIIAFLVSYMKLFPGKRPLVLAPKTTLYTWYKEFIKWDVNIPVHLLHGRGSYVAFRSRPGTVGRGHVPNDVMHVLDSLEKVQKWHAQPSVLVMGYSSFLSLMREDSRFSYRKYMAKVLRESPGILILDEGHNPRSTKSRLRKVLMKVETDLRILLSGTLFQNNFGEYFNTLCLARPRFIKEVFKQLDPKFRRKNNGVEKALHLSECRARKLFIDNIACKIDSIKAEERMQGLQMLKKITSAFIDVYEGGSSDMLPGLQIYTIMMNSTNLQHEILMKLQKIMETNYDGYPLELELLITLAAIHPWLIKTTVCVNKFCSSEELLEVEKLKFDAKKGTKVMFVLNLVYRVVKKEKVLMFCHNIAPINLFLELFETVFKWQRGKEILVLSGDQELFERGRVIDQFEESSVSRVLLASITACAEGISLTAASRVIMLDSEWNPSKTRQAIARAFRPGQQKVVYVYQLLATGTIEEDKYRRTTWKEWVSSMIFSEAFAEDPSRWQAEKIEDDVLREMVEEDRVKNVKSFNKIMKNEKASTSKTN